MSLVEIQFRKTVGCRSAAMLEIDSAVGLYFGIFQDFWYIYPTEYVQRVKSGI